MNVLDNIYGAIFFAALLAFSACASAREASNDTLSLAEQPATIQNLEAAKQQDWQNALDPAVAPVAKEDFLDQMNKADRAIKELNHEFSVPQNEIANALWVPPKSITREDRTQLIQELLAARQQDDRNEKEMLSTSGWHKSVGFINVAKFDQQKELVDSVVRDLEIIEGVHWSTIKEALYVPPSQQ